MAKIKAGLIGYGYWGPNIARVINESPDIELVYCADLNKLYLENVKKKYPQVKTTKNYKKILNDNKIQAIFIATPLNSHFIIAKDSLLAKKHVFIEKPFTNSTKEAQELIEIAKINKTILTVGHVFLFNPAVRYMKKIINDGSLGDIRHLHFQRRNLGQFRKDINVMWDLAPHDISMILYLLKEKPVSVLAIGESYLKNGVYDVVSATIKFENSIMVNMIFSWIDPLKIRDVTIVGSKKMMLFDDVNQTDKIKIFDKNATIIENTRDVTFGEYQVALHTGDIHIPAIDNKEPLKEEIDHFISCILNNTNPINDGVHGKQVVKLLELLQSSLDNHSINIKIQ